MNSTNHQREIENTIAAVVAAPANKVTFGQTSRGKDCGQPTSTFDVMLDGGRVGFVEAYYDINPEHKYGHGSEWRIESYEFVSTDTSISLDLIEAVLKDENPVAAKTRLRKAIVASIAKTSPAPRQIIGTDVHGTPILTPRVGDGATKCIGGDSYAGTIIAVSKNGKRVTWQRDNETPKAEHEGPYGHQSFDYTRNTEGPTMEFSLRKLGNWSVVDEPSACYGLAIGTRRTYRDPSF